MVDLAELLEQQAGVVSRSQALKKGLAPHDLKRLQRRRELTVLHPGVYVSHTGSPTWLQRAWGGVLATWPAALTHESALRACEGPGRRLSSHEVVHVAVDRHRRVTAPAGVVVHRLPRLEERVLWNLGPPRLHHEDAALEVAGRARSDLEAIGVLATVVQSRRTTAARILRTADDRPRLPRRAFLTAVLHDVSEGACSVLEHGYLLRVERAHGLSPARRQVPADSARGPVLRDVEYAVGLVVELDSRLFHDTALRRDADFDRDLDAAVDGRQTVRLSYGQVFDRPCRTASGVARLLVARGWTGVPRPCGPTCTLQHEEWWIRATGRT